MRRFYRYIFVVSLLAALGGRMALSGTPPGATPERAWHIETVDAEAYNSPAIVLDAADRPHIAYGSYGFGLRYAARLGPLWWVETIDGGPGTGLSSTSLALDAAGRPHIGYNEYMSDTLRYAWFNGTTWLTETVDSGGGREVEMRLDQQGQAHLAYFSADLALRYAHQVGTSWYTETVDSFTAVPRELALALDSGGQPHVSYCVGGQDLWYAYHDAAGWHTEVVSATSSGRYNSLALDAQDRPHISFAGSCPTWGLCYASKVGVTWQMEQITAGDTGWFSSLVLDGADLPHISYYDWAKHDLEFAHISGTVWVTETVDSAGDVGKATALALDALGQPHIAYVGEFVLKYAVGGTPSLGYVAYLPLITLRRGEMMP